MKQANAKTMAILIKNIEKFENLESVRVIFKQFDEPDAEILKEAIWKADGSGNCEMRSGVMLVPWTIADTFKFKANDFFFADFQIRLTGSLDMPEVATLSLYMSKSLFSEEEAEVDD